MNKKEASRKISLLMEAAEAAIKDAQKTAESNGLWFEIKEYEFFKEMIGEEDNEEEDNWNSSNC